MSVVYALMVESKRLRKEPQTAKGATVSDLLTVLLNRYYKMTMLDYNEHAIV